MSKIERNHAINIFYQVIYRITKQFFPLAIIVLSGVKDFGIYKSLMVISALILAVIIFEVIVWRKNIFIIKDSSIYTQNGILKIKKTEIPFTKINTVDIYQNFVDRILGTSQIKVDTGAAKDVGSEIKFVLDKMKAVEMKNILLKAAADYEKENTSKYKLSVNDLFLYCVLSNSLFQGIGIIFVLFQFFEEIVSEILGIDLTVYMNTFEGKSVVQNIITAIIGFVILILFGLFLSIIINFIRYYDYKVFMEGNKLNISYGLINKKSYSFDRNKIKGIHLKQTVMMQITRFLTIELESVGYGDEKGEKAVLYPLCNEEIKNKIMTELLPEFNFKDEVIKPPKKAYLNFFYGRIIFSIMLNTVVALINIKFIIVSMILSLIILLEAHLKFKNSALGVSDTLLFASYDGYGKKSSIVRLKAVQSFTSSYNYFQHKKGLRNYSAILYGSIFGTRLIVKNLSEDVYSKVVSKIK